MRIDDLAPGALVLLRFDYSDVGETERAVFCGMFGDGEDRQARFAQANDSGDLFTWEAYRYAGRWAYGTSAGRLSLVEVSEDGFEIGS